MEANMFVLLALVVITAAGPITVQESDKCSETCSPSKNFKYEPGTTYTYVYRVDTETNMAGASQDTAKLTITTSADVHVISPCEFALTLRNTRLMHSGDDAGQMKTADRESQFARAVELSELRFSFQDGKVDRVCPSAEEDSWVLNFKKGVLSSLQNSMDDITVSQNVTESDVSGECKTEYEVKSVGYYTTEVKKTKDMLSCSSRHQYKTMLQMTPYNVPSELQTAPIMKGELECTQEIKNGAQMQSSVCTESHVYRPFANGMSGGKTTVKQTLTYSTYKSETRQSSPITSKDSLTYDHVHANAKLGRVEVEQQLRQICETSKYDIRPESPRQFSELVSAMRDLSEQDLEDLHKLLKTKTMCPDNEKTYKFFLDALPLMSTDASVKLMSSLILKGEINAALSKAWIVSLGFVATPTAEMLVKAKKLIDSDKTSESALLPVSAMVNNYCRKTACEEDYAVLSIMASLERNIGYRCDASGKKFEQVLLSLRAIGNAGHASRAAGPITSCLTNTKNPMEIRVAAAQAFRRMPCDAKDEDLWSTYENGNLDSELRVAAYLALMRCPTEPTMCKMAGSLSNEEDDQVGTFVYSHLTNLKKTSDPHRQEVAQAAANLVLAKEFEMNPLKFSRNYEASLLLNRLNLGFSTEGNLVWSSESQMPRSISGNFTVDLFGQSINMIDFGARLEGLEYVVKKMFGGSEEGSPKQLKAEDIEGSIYGRIFGNEMLFMHSKTMQSPMKQMPSSWLDLLIQLSKKQDYTLTQSAQFMDVSLVIPTIAGLPIHIDVNGTGTFDLVLNGKADLRKLGSSPRSLDIDGEIRPSAAVEITGTMSVDAMVTRTGLRMRNTMHTSTAMKGRVQLQRGQLLNMELDTPQDKMEVFSAGSKFFILHNDMEQEQVMITDNRKDFKFCSGDEVSQIVGMELCGELSFPNASMTPGSPHFPLSGPASASLTLNKKDSHKSYKLFAKRVENKKASIAQISFKTPGSKVDRTMLLEAEINYPKQTMAVELRTPWKKASVKGATINDDKMKSLSGSVIVDDADEYAFTSEVKIDSTKSKMQISPMVEIRRTGADNIQLTGFMSLVTPFKVADLEMSLSGLSKMPYTMKANMKNNKKDGRGIVASVSADGKNKYTIEANNQFEVMGKKSIIASIKNMLKVNTPTKQIIFLDTSADYKEGKSLKADATLDIYRLIKKPANLKISLIKNAKKRGVRYDADINIKSDKLTGKLDSFTLIKPSGLVATKHVLTYTIPKVAKNKITLGGKFNDRSTNAYKKYSLKSNLDVSKSPEYNLGLNIDVDHKKKHSSAEIELKYGKNPKDKTKKITWSTSLNRKLATWKNSQLTFKMDAAAPAHNVDITLLGKHQHSPKALDSSVNLNYGGKGNDLTAEVSLKDKSTKMDKFNGKASIAGFGKEYSIASSLDQKSAKQYNHVLNLKGDKTKHSITTMYKSAKGNDHSFNTKFALQGMKPLTISGSTNLDPRNFDMSGEVVKGKDAYGFKTNTKLTKTPSAKVDVELFYPSRRMTLLVDGGKQKGKYAGRVEASWDADSKDASVVLDGSAYMKKAKNALSLGGDLEIKTPFTEDISTGFKYGQDDSQHDMSGKMSLGTNMVSSSLNVKRPISFENMKMSADAKTSFKGFKIMSVDVDHSLSPLKTIVAGKWEKENGKLTVEGNGDINNFKGTAGMKSTLKGAKDIKLTVAHSNGNGKLNSNAKLDVNGKSYAYDMNMAHAQNDWDIKNSGDFMMTQPGSKAKASWNHKSSDQDMKSSVSADIGKDHWEVNVDGSHDLINAGKLSGNIQIATPLKSLKKVDINLSHDHGNNKLINKATLKQNGKMQASSLVKYNGRPSEHNLEFALETPFHKNIDGKINGKFAAYPLTSSAEISYGPKKGVATGSLDFTSSNIKADIAVRSPFSKDISAKVDTKYDSFPMTGLAELNWGAKSTVEGSLDVKDTKFNAQLEVASPYSKDLTAKINSKFNSYPMTGVAEFSWAPKSKVVLEGSVNTPALDDASVELKLTTPFRNYRNIAVKASNKNEQGEIVSNMDLTYGVRKSFDIETRVAMNDMKKMARLSLRTPFENMKSINTGFMATGEATNFDGSVDFEMQPIVGKLSSNVNWKYDDNLKGTVRIDTPFKDYPYFELSTSSKDKGPLRQSVIKAEYSPRQVYSFESNYRFDMPISVEATINSPFPQFDNLGLALQHSNTDSTVKTHGEVTYQPGQKVEGDLNMDWTSDIEGMLIVKTPFTGYKTSKVVLRHTGELDNFASHGEAAVAEQTVSADASFKSGFATEGKFTFNSPIPGLESLDMSFNKRGNMKNAKGQATISLNGDKSQASFSHKMSKGLKSAFSLDTPITKKLTMSIDHEGSIDSFTNKLSATYGKSYDVDTVLAFNNQGSDISGNGMIKARLSGPQQVARITFSKSGLLEDLSFGATAGLNKEDVSLNGSWKLMNGIEGSVTLTTPFDDFKNMAMSLSHTGDIYNFKTESSMNVEDKKINGKVQLSSSGINRIRFDTNLFTPFECMKSTELNVMHDFNGQTLSGKATLDSTISKFGKGSIAYSKTGNMDSFNAQLNGKYSDKEAVLSVSKKGDFDDLTVSTSASLNGEAVSVDGSLKTLNGIDASVNLKTPFTNFKKLGLKVAHRGEMKDFHSEASLDYSDNKNVNAMIDFSADDMCSIKLSTEVNTPRELLGNSKMSLTNECNGNQISTKGDFSCALGTSDFQFSKSGSLSDLTVEAKATMDGENVINGKVTNNYESLQSLKTFATIETIMTPKMEISIDHTGSSLTNFNSKAQGKFGSDNVMSLESSMSNKYDVIDAEGKAMYRTQNGGNQGSLTFHKEGPLNDFSVKMTGDLNADKISFDGALKVKNQITGSMSVNTPFKGYKNVGMSFTHSGSAENFKTNGEVNMPNGQKYSAKLDFYKYLLQRVETVFEVRTPIADYEFNKFEYRHEGNSDSFTCYSTVEYGNNKKIIYNMKSAMSPNPTMTVTLKTPFPKYEDMMASTTLKNNLPALSTVSAKVNAGNGMVASLEGNLNINDISGSLAVTTPVEDFTNVGMSFKHSGNMKSFKSEGKVTYMDNKNIEGKVNFKGQDIYAELKTPFKGNKFMSYEQKVTSSKKQYKKDTTVTYNNKVTKSSERYVWAPDMEFHYTLESPIEGFESVSFSNVLDFNGPKFSFDSNLKMAKNIYDLKSALDISGDVSGSALLKAPMTGFKKMGVEFGHTGNAEQFNCNGKVFADKDEVSGKVNFYHYMWKSLTASAELSTPFAEFENNKVEVKYENGKDEKSASVEVNGQKVDGTLKMATTPKYDFELAVNTPFAGFKKMKAVANADLESPRYSVLAGVSSGRKAFTATGKLNLFSASNLDASLEFKTPIESYELTRAEYEHNIDSSSVSGKATLACKNQQVSAELQSTIYPTFDATVTVKTPFQGYNIIQGSASYANSYKKYDASSSLKLEGSNLFTMTSGVDYSLEPMRAFSKISFPEHMVTPFELILTHQGDLFNFKSTGFMTNPLTNTVNAEAAFEFNGVTDMTLSGSVKSSLPGFDNLRMEVKTSDNSGEKKISAVAGWTDGQQIVTEAAFRNQENWRESTMAADFTLSTPFVALSGMAVQAEGSSKSEGKDAKLAIDLNGAKILDVNGDYSSRDKKEATLTFKQPRAMQFTASGSNMDMDVYANWDRDDMNSNIRVIASGVDNSPSAMTLDRAFDVTIERANNKMGVSHTHMMTGNKIASTGKMFWGLSADDKISYEMDLIDNSRRNKKISEHVFKLALPSRTLELSGSMINSPAAKTADTSFKWDADRDDTKCVGIKATMAKGDSIRGDITLSLPAMQKEIKVDGELMLNNGRIILDSKTDFIYSKDSRKTVTLISKVKSISRKSMNYSVEMGLSHPYTNIDVQMTSTVGNSDEKMTFAMESTYLTARRETKTMALMTEINKIKKQISVQMMNPLTKVEIIGDVVSETPCKLRLLNKIDDEEVFQSNMIIDSDRKCVELTAEMGEDKYAFNAEYPTIKDFTAYVTHSDAQVSHQDAVFALTLNNTRLMHSRLAWRPTAIAEMTNGLKQKAAVAGIQYGQKFAVINNEIAKEISAKYIAVSSHMKEEVTPFIDALEKSLLVIASEMRNIQAAQPFMRESMNLVASLRKTVSDIVAFRAGEKYQNLVAGSIVGLSQNLIESLTSLEKMTASVEAALENYKEASKAIAKKITNTVTNTSFTNYAQDMINHAKNVDISPYMRIFEVPQEYNTIVSEVKDMGMSGMKTLWARPEFNTVRGTVNEVYQQGSWAYKYWNVEQNIQQNIEHIMTLLVEIAEAEAHEMKTRASSMYKNPITVLTGNEVQAEFSLPFDMSNLQEIPDFQPMVVECEKFALQVSQYLPNKKTLDNAVETVSGLFKGDKPKEIEDMKTFKPSKKYRAKKGKKFNKKGKKYNKM